MISLTIKFHLFTSSLKLARVEDPDIVVIMPSSSKGGILEKYIKVFFFFFMKKSKSKIVLLIIQIICLYGLWSVISGHF